MQTCSFYFAGDIYAYIHFSIYTHAVGTHICLYFDSSGIRHRNPVVSQFTCTCTIQVAAVLVRLKSMSKNVFVCKEAKEKKKNLYSTYADVKRGGQTKKKVKLNILQFKIIMYEIAYGGGKSIGRFEPFQSLFFFFFCTDVCVRCAFEMDNTKNERNIKEIVRLSSSIVVHTHTHTFVIDHISYLIQFNLLERENVHIDQHMNANRLINIHFHLTQLRGGKNEPEQT